MPRLVEFCELHGDFRLERTHDFLTAYLFDREDHETIFLRNPKVYCERILCVVTPFWFGFISLDTKKKIMNFKRLVQHIGMKIHVYEMSFFRYEGILHTRHAS